MNFVQHPEDLRGPAKILHDARPLFAAYPHPYELRIALGDPWTHDGETGARKMTSTARASIFATLDRAGNVAPSKRAGEIFVDVDLTGIPHAPNRAELAQGRQLEALHARVLELLRGDAA